MSVCHQSQNWWFPESILRARSISTRNEIILIRRCNFSYALERFSINREKFCKQNREQTLASIILNRKVHMPRFARVAIVVEKARNINHTTTSYFRILPKHDWFPIVFVFHLIWNRLRSQEPFIIGKYFPSFNVKDYVRNQQVFHGMSSLFKCIRKLAWKSLSFTKVCSMNRNENFSKPFDTSHHSSFH